MRDQELDMRKKISKKISEKTQAVSDSRRKLCEYVKSKIDPSASDNICGLIDDLCLQFESLGRLKGELEMSDIMESICEQKQKDIIKEEHTQPFF